MAPPVDEHLPYLTLTAAGKTGRVYRLLDRDGGVTLNPFQAVIAMRFLEEPEGVRCEILQLVPDYAPYRELTRH